MVRGSEMAHAPITLMTLSLPQLNIYISTVLEGRDASLLSILGIGNLQLYMALYYMNIV